MPWYIKRKAPLVLGHEPVGIVEQTGAAVRDFKIGDRVFVHHHALLPMRGVPARRIRAVRDLARDQYRAGRDGGVFSRERGQSTRHAAPSRFDRRRRRCADRAGRMRRQVAQALGPQVQRINSDHRSRHHGHDACEARAASRRRDDHRRRPVSFARQPRTQLGADRGIVVEGDNLVEQVREITNGAMADVVIVGPGTSKAIATGIAAAGKGATVVQFTATPPDDDLLVKPHDLYFNETRLVPSYSCGPDETREAFSLVERGVINAKELVTHRFPLAQITEAFATAQKPESLKVIVLSRVEFSGDQKPQLSIQSGREQIDKRGRLPMQPPS